MSYNLVLNNVFAVRKNVALSFKPVLVLAHHPIIDSIFSFLSFTLPKSLYYFLRSGKILFTFLHFFRKAEILYCFIH